MEVRRKLEAIAGLTFRAIESRRFARNFLEVLETSYAR
jgi:hypothetical protein